MKRFIVAVKTGSNYSFGFVKLDPGEQVRTIDFYYNVIKTSFPSREHVSVMLTKWRSESAKTLYSATDVDKFKNIVNNDQDTMFAMVFDQEWEMLIERK